MFACIVSAFGKPPAPPGLMAHGSHFLTDLGRATIPFFENILNIYFTAFLFCCWLKGCMLLKNDQILHWKLKFSGSNIYNTKTCLYQLKSTFYFIS